MADICQSTARLRAAGIYTSGTSKQTFRFIPFTARAVNFGYSDSGFQGAVLTCYSGRHAQHWVEHLRSACQAVSTLLAGQMARELNFTDITI